MAQSAVEVRDPPRRHSVSRFKCKLITIAASLLCNLAAAQTTVPLQPFVQDVRQVETALAYLGEPLPPKDENAINTLAAKTDQAEAVSGLEQVLDKYTLAIVEINPESRVKVQPGSRKTRTGRSRNAGFPGEGDQSGRSDRAAASEKPERAARLHSVGRELSASERNFLL